ncbi:MAG: signal recognition particle-docking protein FtsY [Candidatus Kapabacteria bacterium]|nr:signal recognition particle-docking protein FtsY [Candidatus Kapabacteria bacterium]MCS7169057.1 signal recognition particle-docking protein FtsY [Candidatus Kapabacteria bacterium]MDW7997290.1 signal recognition particle-docking protein FtsY [Bacteroidota bacterium]MDW8225119.1 signal recognition particle-docking protein FtsY [Bacteroidota bacterium]
MSFVQALSAALARTRQRIAQALSEIGFQPYRETEALNAVETALLQVDIGVGTTRLLVSRLRERLHRQGSDSGSLERLLLEEMRALLPDPPAESFPGAPTVVLVVGVNGFGKTTTVAKLAYRWRLQGKSVVLAAADTYRAAAIEQLQQWAERVGVLCIRHQYGADPAAVAYDAVQAARARAADIVLVDTAGRLHTKAPLMAELEKLVRVVRKAEPTAPHETLLVLDASVGQNALVQAREFHHRLSLTGIVLTKMDGSARGGIALAVAHTYGLPVRYLGIGEGLEDLVPFEPDAFIASLSSGVEK